MARRAWATDRPITPNGTTFDLTAVQYALGRVVPQSHFKLLIAQAILELEASNSATNYVAHVFSLLRPLTIGKPSLQLR